MKKIFSELNRSQAWLAFERFASMILSRKAVQLKKEIEFNASLESNDFVSESKQFAADAYAPYGFETNQPTFFEFKTQISNLKTLDNLFFRFYETIKSGLCPSNSKFIVITYFDIAEEYLYKSHYNDKYSADFIDFEIWGKTVIDTWIDEYPIDYQNTIARFSEKSVTPSQSKADVTFKDFDKKNESNIALLKDEINEGDNFALVLGAGVSIDLGAQSWKNLLLGFEAELLKRGVIHDATSVKETVGSSALITAQLCKDLYSSDKDFYWAIHNGLYPTVGTKYSAEMNEIIEIIKRYHMKKHFRILTYNFDDYLERHLNKKGIKYNTLFNEKGVVDDRISIYHVHGFLPQVGYKSHIQDIHSKSIFLTEENYNDLYNKPYSWQISSQLSFFRENQCLFVGCSLSDPNIRRLLEITRESTKKTLRHIS